LIRICRSISVLGTSMDYNNQQCQSKGFAFCKF
jgi:hypothetical protein